MCVTNLTNVIHPVPDIVVMTGSDFFTSADPLLSSNSLFTLLNNNISTAVGPPSPPWNDDDLDGLGLIDSKDDLDDFLSYSPESLGLDSETDEAISSFLTTVSPAEAEATVARVLDDFDDLSTTSSSDSYENSSTLNLSDLCEQQQQPPLESPRGQSEVGHCCVCKLVFAASSLLEGHRADYANRVTCCHCQKNFATLSKLRIHHRKHSKEKPYQCQICGKYYTHRNTLSRHQLLYCRPLRAKCESEATRSIAEDDSMTKMILEAEVVLDDDEQEPHQEQKQSRSQRKRSLPHSNKLESSSILGSNKVAKSGGDTKCIVCDREFFDPPSLENHREYHLGTRECCRCHKVLGNKSKLLTHHRSHTKELPYACSLCSKSFAELSTLRKHEATHGERNFHCDICSKAFVRKDYLAKHSLTHRQTYKCSQCSYVCHNRQVIERHVTDHDATSSS